MKVQVWMDWWELWGVSETTWLQEWGLQRQCSSNLPMSTRLEGPIMWQTSVQVIKIWGLRFGDTTPLDSRDNQTLKWYFIDCIFREGCLHGFCIKVIFSVEHSTNWIILLKGLFQPGQCLCHNGWRGKTCRDCVPYWNCPYTGPGSCKVGTDTEQLVWPAPKDPNLSVILTFSLKII